MDGSGAPPLQQVNLQTLVSAIQNSVQAQNLIATRLSALTDATLAATVAFSTFAADFAAVFPAPLSSSVTWNPPNLVNQASETTTISVAGAVSGNYVQVSFSLDLQGLSLTGYVSAADTVTVILSNLTGGAVDLASGTLKVRVTTV